MLGRNEKKILPCLKPWHKYEPEMKISRRAFESRRDQLFLIHPELRLDPSCDAASKLDDFEHEVVNAIADSIDPAPDTGTDPDPVPDPTYNLAPDLDTCDSDYDSDDDTMSDLIPNSNTESENDSSMQNVRTF